MKLDRKGEKGGGGGGGCIVYNYHVLCAKGEVKGRSPRER